MLKNHLLLLVSIILACICSSCEPEEDLGFPSKIEISGKGETIEIKGSKDFPLAIIQIQVLDNNGEGYSSGSFDEVKDCLETTTDWLMVKYYFAENKLVLNAAPNETKKNRKLYLFLLNGKSRQEITVTQSK